MWHWLDGLQENTVNACDKAQEEIDEVLKKHGIGTYIVVMKDPDTQSERRCYNGSMAWVVGHCSFLKDEVIRRYNSSIEHSDG